jgi:hypothetical protein
MTSTKQNAVHREAPDAASRTGSIRFLEEAIDAAEQHDRREHGRVGRRSDDQPVM